MSFDGSERMPRIKRAYNPSCSTAIAVSQTPRNLSGQNHGHTAYEACQDKTDDNDKLAVWVGQVGKAQEYIRNDAHHPAPYPRAASRLSSRISSASSNTASGIVSGARNRTTLP